MAHFHFDYHEADRVTVDEVGLVVLGVSGLAVVAFLGLAGHGLGRALTDILRFAVLQRNTPDELRGWISSLWQVQVVAGTAVGSLVAGLLGGWLAPDTALLVYGVACLLLTGALVAVFGALWRVTNDPAPAAAPAPDPRPSEPAPEGD